MPPSVPPPGPPPEHGFVHVVPAAQSADCLPLQLTWQGVVPPQVTEHSDEPVQSTVQPPFGHATAQLLFPVQESVLPVSIVTLQSAPPPQLTVLFVPVVSVQSLVPVHVEVQFDWHVPLHVDCASHVVVHPVPQVESHVFFESQ